MLDQRKMFLLICISLILSMGAGQDQLEQARQFLTSSNEAIIKACTKYQFAQWAYSTNINDDTYIASLEASNELDKEFKIIWNGVKEFPWRDFQDADLYRQFLLYSNIEDSSLPDEKAAEFSQVKLDMATIYSEARFCEYENQNKCDLDVGAAGNIFRQSSDPAELAFYWEQFKIYIGDKIGPLYPRYVQLLNEAAVLNGFKNGAEMWSFDFENLNMEPTFQSLLDQLFPLYKELHAYMRRKIREKYGSELVSEDGPIPLHLIRGQFGFLWIGLQDFSMPYPNKFVDLTQSMENQGYTVNTMFVTAEEFFTSLGLEEMNDSFWENSMFTKPDNRIVNCQGSAYDFCDGKDYRISICASVQDNDFDTAHHLIGSLEYYMAYREQPFVYRDGANPGFLEGLGDLIALSVYTQKHFARLQLITQIDDSKEAEINFLYRLALDKVVFMSFGFIVDVYRWRIFRGEITEDNYNCEWWKLVLQYQGVAPPVKRSEENFDAGGMYHVANNVRYISYFAALVLQFQFYRELCIVSNQYDPNNANMPLHKCDFYDNKDVGDLLRNMMKLGSSQPWPDTLNMFVGNTEMDASAMLEYFKPLFDWLVEDNIRNNAYVGWNWDIENVCE